MHVKFQNAQVTSYRRSAVHLRRPTPQTRSSSSSRNASATLAVEGRSTYVRLCTMRYSVSRGILTWIECGLWGSPRAPERRERLRRRRAIDKYVGDVDGLLFSLVKPSVLLIVFISVLVSGGHVRLSLAILGVGRERQTANGERPGDERRQIGEHKRAGIETAEM